MLQFYKCKEVRMLPPYVPFQISSRFAVSQERATPNIQGAALGEGKAHRAYFVSLTNQFNIDLGRMPAPQLLLVRPHQLP
jgi:hypothetical protein